jgi:activator of HSP90 ATPase
MPITIKQRVRFKVPPGKLFRYYIDSKLHSELTGGKARVGTEVGSSFSAFGGSLKGKTLLSKKNKMFVQTWRSAEWPKEDMDSVLVLVFREIENGTELEMIHANVPDSDAAGVKNGWNEYYWKPWKAYIG